MTAPADQPACPNRDAWSAFHAGLVGPDAFPRFATHLDRCDTCRAVLDTLAADAADAADPFAGEAAGRAAVDRVRGLVPGGPPDPALPETIGEYRVLGPLGRGGMGVVYWAVHARLGREVALKTFPPGRAADAAAVARFHRETAALGRLDHPNVVRATDAGEADGVAYLAMDLVDGVDLARLAKACGPLPAADACELARQAAAGLQHLASHGLVHRDVKPSNLMLDRAGAVKLLDLGLAVVPGGGPATTPGQAVGTFDYMAPEQADPSRRADPRADVYALGGTLFHLLTGGPPFPAAGVREKLAAHAAAPVPAVRGRRPDVPAGVEAAVRRMLAKDPADRFPTPGAAADALAPFCRGHDLPRLLAVAAGAAPPPAVADRPRTGGRRWARAAAAAVVLAAAAGGLSAALRLWPTALPVPIPPDVTSPVTADAPPPAAVPTVYPTAVIRFEERAGVPKGAGAVVSDLLAAALATDPKFLLVERTDLQHALDELKLSQSGAVRPGTEGKVGQLTGAKLMVMGSVMTVDRKRVLVAKVVGTETGRVLGATADGPADGELGPPAEALAAKVAAIVADQARVLAPPAPPAADRAAAVRKAVGAKARPAVTLAGPADDAAETARAEFARLLRDCGFEVFDPDAAGRAAVELVVTAAYDPGADRGGLHTATARVTARAVERATGRVLVADRQTARAVDLTFPLAGQKGVEEAAGALAARVLPSLVK